MAASFAQVDSFAGNSTCAALTQHRQCPVCGGIRNRFVLELSGFQFYTDSAEQPKRTDIRTVQCVGCFALFMNPCYSDYGFQILFAEAGRSYGSGSTRAERNLAWLASKGLTDDGAKVLDVGCNDGRFLASLPDGVIKIGLDIDEPAIVRGREQHGDAIELLLGNFDDFVYDGTFDTITMFHVLEHLPRPIDSLIKLASVSHKDTKLVVEVPILESETTNDINGFIAPQHMTHFSRRSLRNCLGRAGWSIVDTWHSTEYNGYRVVCQLATDDYAVQGDPADTGRLHGYLSDWHRSLANVATKLEPVAESANCVVWGAGMHLEFLYHMTSWFQARADRDVLVVDNDPMKQGKSWRGLAISSTDVVSDIDWSDTVLIVSSYGDQDAIADEAMRKGVPEHRIVKLYDHLRVY